MPDEPRRASPRAVGWGCAAAIVAFALPFALAFLVFPVVLGAYLRWRGDYGANQSPEALAILTTIVAGPFLFFLSYALGFVLAVLAVNSVSRWLDRKRLT